MTDTPPPSWPAAGQPPEPPPPTPSPSPTPVPASAGEPPTVRPSWDAVSTPVERGVDLKLIIAVLIGLVSVTGAAVAWQSSLAGEKATDKDRQSVAETVTEQQAETDNQLIVEDARLRFADHLAATVSARQLEQQADRFAGLGDGDRSRAAADAAAEQQSVAVRALAVPVGDAVLGEYVSEGPDGLPAFEERELQADLAAESARSNRVNSGQTVREANRLRAESQRLDGWLIALVGAIAVLTLAQISRQRPLRLGLAGLGGAIWIVSSVLAFTGS